MLISIILIAFSLIAINTGQEIVCNDVGRDLLDRNIQKTYLFGAPDRHYPTNKAEFRKFCSDNLVLNSQIKQYKDKCLDNLSKQIVSLLTYSTNYTIYSICKSPRRSKEFLKMARCGNAAKPETIKCWNTLTYRYEGVKLVTQNKLKLPLLCCNFFVMKSCNVEAYEKNGKVCKQSSVDGLDLLLDKFVIDVIATLCGDYVFESDKCDKIIGLTPKPDKYITQHSPILQFIDVLDSVPLN